MSFDRRHRRRPGLVVAMLLIASSGVPQPSPASPRDAAISGAGLVGLSISDDGHTGNFFQGPSAPSLRYPVQSTVEHLFHGGLWVGARRLDGSIGVSTAAEDANDEIEGQERREFGTTGETIRIMSNVQNSPDYHPDALAPFHLVCSFHDWVTPAEGDHVPLGLLVTLDALAWNTAAEDDAVVLRYRIVNASGSDLHDLHVGYFNDTTVGDTEYTDPYDPDAPAGWNYYDDVNGAWSPDDVPGENDPWVMWEHDADGDQGLATSWVGCALLGTEPPVEPPAGVPPVSYNAWRFRDVPPADDLWLDDDLVQQPGKYQLMSNGDWDVGYAHGIDYSIPSDWLAMLSTGPLPILAAGDTLTVAFAVVCGPDSTAFRDNARHLAEVYAAGYDVVGVDVPALESARLLPPTPNPFNPATRIAFELPRAAWIELTVVGLDGRRLRTLVAGHRDAGLHRLRWDGQDRHGRSLPSGVYLVRLQAGDAPAQVRPVTLVR